MMTYTKEQIVAMLETSTIAVEHALVALFARQTADEQAAEVTSHHNGMGFNGRDAEFYSSLAKRVLNLKSKGVPSGQRLTPNMVASLRKRNKRGAMAIAKYAGQLLEIANSGERRAAA